MKQAENLSVFDNIWKFFASVRLTVAVLLTLAGASVIGTLIPQNGSHELYFRKYGEVLYRIFHVFDFFDMYHSWWFRLLILTLTANIIVCSFDRLSALWKVVFVKEPAFRISSFRNISRKTEFTTGSSAGDLKQDIVSHLGKYFGYVRAEETETGYCIFAEKGRWTRLGVYIVHFSIVLLLAGSLIGSIFGFEGFVNIPEGESVRSIMLRNSDKTQALDFEIRCEDFDVSFYETGAPKEFRSSLVILENGKEVFKKDVIVNDPIRYRGINIFQSSYGKIPVNPRISDKDEITLSFTSRASGMLYNKKVYMNQATEIPEGGGTLVLRELVPSYMFMGQKDLGPAYVGTVTQPDGTASEVHLPVRFPRFDRMRQGADFTIAVEHTHTDMTEKYYTGLQVTHDPGVLTVYAGFIFIIVGCYITFFMSHQRLCAEVIQKEGNNRVIISGSANKNPLGMENTVRKISQELARQENGKMILAEEIC
ncbi:MAG: cytochrome c biogenesis protein ResB [Desulfococcaceae bacterium]